MRLLAVGVVVGVAVTAQPTLHELTALVAAVQAYRRKVYPRRRCTTSDLPELLAELRETIEKVESVTRGAAAVQLKERK
jgi:hypothetical protein